MLEAYYLPVKAIHILFVIAWMAGILYLPRLFVYHEENKDSKRIYDMFLVMEKRLITLIILPSIIGTFLSGIVLLHMPCAVNWQRGSIYVKLFLVLILTLLQHIFIRYWRNFQKGKNKKSSVFYRIMNEIPFILAIGIVFLVVMKPL